MPFLICAVRCRSCRWKRRGERGGSPATCSSGEAVLEVVDGGLPVVAGVWLTREVFFNLWKYSFLLPGNGARKTADG
jgi:hypothetical protein